MKLPCYQVAAFAANPFHGNPAGVCPLERWLPDATLQRIAANNNLSETAFTVPRGDDFELRWFTPTVEMDLCGHATLGAAFVLFSERGARGNEIRFHSPSGLLTVSREGDLLTLNFPSRPATPCAAPDALIRGLGAQPKEVLRSRDFLAVFAREEEVRVLQPDFAALATLDCTGVIATAPGEDCDFVSRFFAPQSGVNEDPVTGSAHCTLIPFWAARLGKTKMFARQISQRGGELHCELVGDRVRIGGQAVLYLRGEIEIEDVA
ncbi:MAG: PhzF family phenazine biosynthesis protein [Verrucomicrobia bacterium]|nr:MAG: PhzF family phenazine biosynthesis protein [Verrucomicrobiota bacterium]